MTHFRSATLVVALTAAVPLFAQTQPRLIGVATNPALAAAQNLRQDMATCLTKVCTVPLPPPPTPNAGGTAYDASLAAVWETTGLIIGLFDPNTCAPICPPFPISPLINNNVATGLALNESTRTLWVSDNTNRIYQFGRAVTAPCNLIPITSCPTPFIPAGMTIGGLATSDVQNLVYYSASVFGGGPPNNIVYIANQNTPCAPICKFPLQGCGPVALGPITGLAYDDCKGVMWATDGFTEVAVIVGPPNCVPNVVQCCQVPGPERYIGLCIQPSQAVPTGVSCTAPPCPICPTMTHNTIGDPALGNPFFALTLDNAPAGVPSLLCINAGACLAAGIPIPPFCGPLRVALPGIITLGFPTGGGVGCSGQVTVGVPVPLNPALCGIPLSSQFLVVCPTAALVGTGVSNCLSWMVSGT